MVTRIRTAYGLLVTAVIAAVASHAVSAQALGAADPDLELIEWIARIRAEVGPTPVGLASPLR
jgi:hypothetical protein